MNVLKHLNDLANSIETARSNAQAASKRAEKCRTMMGCTDLKHARLIVPNNAYEVPFAYRNDTDLTHAVQEIIDGMTVDILRIAELQFEREAKVQAALADRLTQQLKSSVVIQGEAE